MTVKFSQQGKRSIIISFTALLAAVGYLIFNPEAADFLRPSKPNVHHSADAMFTLSDINIKAFYFIPNDKQTLLDGNWQAKLAKALSDLRQFYSFQLHQAVKITFEIYPQPIIGQHEALVYDGADTARGNPNALLSIREELLNRQSSFIETGQEDYGVIAVLYEGVGSSATLIKNSRIEAEDTFIISDDGPPAFLVSRYFLSDSAYKDYGTSIFAHEFGHTLGLPDAYNLTTNQPLSDDIMGAGRFRPIQFSYLSMEAKKLLGLSY